jgi:lipid II:glycine glycyltransferase (peptidoglycan interpeptide bridge formation enzyme)
MATATMPASNFHPTRRQVFTLNPLTDPRWSEFIDSHPHASIFHSTRWLNALYLTYGYEPIVVSTSGPKDSLVDGIVLCKISSWISGSRFVSLPFSDHCHPLVEDPDHFEEIIRFLESQVKNGRCKYLEIRPFRELSQGACDRAQMQVNQAYCIHLLDLSPTLTELYRNFHKNCVQRKIAKAEREGFCYEEGQSEELLSKFYKLLLSTRRRHRLPPQSRAWFRNLAESLGDQLKIRVVSKNAYPVASIITCHFKDTVVYKYGCSDARYHSLGATFLLMWRAIQDAKASRARYFDFGRSEEANVGLVAFKDHWGATKFPLPYYRYPTIQAVEENSNWKLRLMQRTCAHLPDPLLELLGGLLYKHVG